VLQGVGGALMVPVGRLAVLRATAKADLIKAIAYLTWPALLAPVLAPAIGGVLSEYASWRWIFVINVPLGIAGLLLVRRLVPDLRARDTLPRLDRAGFVLVAAGIAALMVAVENVGEGAIDVPFAAGGAVLAAALLAVAVIHLLRASAPLLDLRILRILSFRVTATGGSGVPDGDHRDPVPAAAAVPARVRVERSPGRPGGDRAVRGATSRSSR
jgi:MFS family permease